MLQNKVSCFLNPVSCNLNLQIYNLNGVCTTIIRKGYHIRLVFMLIGFAVAGLFLATIISIPVWTSMTGKSIFDMPEEMKNPANADAIKMTQVISVLVGLFLPAVFTAFLLNRKPYRLLGFTQGIKIKQAGLVILIMFVAVFVTGTAGYLNQKIPVPENWRIIFQKLEDTYAQQVEIMASFKNAGDYLLALVIIAILPALCEETLFRGGLQNFLYRSTTHAWLSIVIVSILFSVVHFSYYGFLPRMFLGIVLGLIFYYTGSLWLCILAHFFNNALAITQLYIYTRQGKSIQESMADEFPYYWGIIALPILILLLSFLKKMSPKLVIANASQPVILGENSDNN